MLIQFPDVEHSRQTSDTLLPATLMLRQGRNTEVFFALDYIKPATVGEKPPNGPAWVQT